MPADKRTNCVKVCFEDDMYAALKAEAARDDRRPADFVYLIVRRHMYGICAQPTLDWEGTEKD